MPEDYIHRVGRTARAEPTGDAFTFVSPDEERGAARPSSARSAGACRACIVPDFDYAARPETKLEIPLAERIAQIRAKKAEDRERSKAKAARREANGQASSARPGPRADRPGSGAGQRGPGGAGLGAEGGRAAAAAGRAGVVVPAGGPRPAGDAELEGGNAALVTLSNTKGACLEACPLHFVQGDSVKLSVYGVTVNCSVTSEQPITVLHATTSTPAPVMSPMRSPFARPPG